MNLRALSTTFIVCWCIGWARPAKAQPAGDLCQDAPTIPCGSTTILDNTLAGTDASDPGYSCHFDGPGTQGVGTVWFKFVADDTSAVVSTCESTDSGDTILGVFDGTCGAFTELACSEDACGGTDLLSSVCVSGLTVGNTYYIQVATYSEGSRGEITLDLSCPCPAADICDIAEALTLPSGVIAFDNSVNTPDANPDDGSCNAGAPVMQNDRWFSVTTGPDDCNLIVNVDAVSGYDLIATVYSGADCDSLLEEACIDTPDDPGNAIIPALANSTYWIRVGDWGFVPEGGQTTLEVSCPVTLPTGACCSTIDGTCIETTLPDCEFISGDYQGDDTLCADGPCISACCLDDGCQSVNGLVTGFPELDCEDPVESGGLGGIWLGPGTDCATAVCPPENDDCADAQSLTLPVSIDFNNEGALASSTGGAGSCNVEGATALQNDVWFTVTTGPAACDLTFELSSTNFYDMMVPVYSGTDCNDLVEVACGNEPQDPLEFVVPTTPNTTYWIRVGDWGSFAGGGPTRMTIQCVPPCGTCPGDVSADNLVNGADLQPFVNCYLAPADGCGCADIDRDGDTDDDDVTQFTDLLLNETGDCPEFPTDSCEDAPLYPCNTVVSLNNANATTDPTDPGFSCHFTAPGTQGLATMWLRFQASDTSALIGNCNSEVLDTELAVYDGTCGALTELACSEDDCGLDGLLSRVCVEGLTPGNIYYIQVASFTSSSQGSMEISIECPCPFAPDECAVAEPVSCGSSITFSNVLATPDAFNAPLPTDPVPSCSLEGNPAQATVWYTFTGDGQNWTIESCNTPDEPASIADTTLSIWTGECGALTELACGEDDCNGGNVANQGGTPQPWMSRVTVPTVNGQQYWILWSNAFGDRGKIQMDVSCSP
ncbi:MAG TPA: hypothetical protein VNT79_17680 [Phycisphaerae bacterium]|nr:hypothetical protein [Phycisphaerae bacterium]